MFVVLALKSIQRLISKITFWIWGYVLHFCFNMDNICYANACCSHYYTIFDPSNRSESLQTLYQKSLGLRFSVNEPKQRLGVTAHICSVYPWQPCKRLLSFLAAIVELNSVFYNTAAAYMCKRQAVLRATGNKVVLAFSLHHAHFYHFIILASNFLSL